MSYLRHLCLFALWCPTHIVYPMLTVSLDCPFLIAYSLSFVLHLVYFFPKTFKLFGVPDAGSPEMRPINHVRCKYSGALHILWFFSVN